MAAESEEFERAWAEIVADLTSDAQLSFSDIISGDETAPSPARTGVGEAESQAVTETPSDTQTASDTQTTSDTQTPSDTDGLEGAASSAAEDVPVAAAEPPQPEPAASARTDPAAYLDGWADEGHFTPPPPPDLPVGSPATRLGWAGALGGIVTLVVLTLTGWPVPRIVYWAAGLATLVGFVTLVWQLPDAREDGWDDGARL